MSSASSDGQFVASKDSSSNSDDKSECETLAELERGHTKVGWAAKQTKKNKHPTVASAKKKQPTRKKKAPTISAPTISAPTTTDDCNTKHSTSFSPEELLSVAKAFMKVSSNAKHPTDKKMEKFWEDIHLHYNDLVTTSNKINESYKEYVPVKSHNMESLCNCWHRGLQPAVKKIAGIVSRNKPLSGEVVGVNLMDLY